jgi:hypothetical protein
MTSNTFELVPFEMPRKTYHSQVICQYLLCTILRDIILPAPDHDLEQITENLNFDISVILAIRNTRYLQTRLKVPKSGSLHLAWEYSKNPENHSQFIIHTRAQEAEDCGDQDLPFDANMEDTGGEKDCVWLQNCWHIDRIRNCIHC